MVNILITGGTGTLGKALSQVLASKNIDHTIGSRNNAANRANWTKLDLLNKIGIKEALKDKNIIFHLATDMKRDSEITQNLLAAIENKEKAHLIYISIVGADKVPLAYYKRKVASESLIKQSGVSYSILRATQFHEYADKIISTCLKYPIGFLPKKIVVQPIQKEVVAEELWRLATNQPTNNTEEIGGVESLTLHDMSGPWLEATGRKRIIIPLPILGALGKSLYSGQLTTPKIKAASMTWKSWLKTKYI